MSTGALPRAQRPRFPEGYGLPDTDEGLLRWDQVRPRLEAATEYWLATVRPDGRPHVVPRWGVWVDDTLYYDGAPTTIHAQNLRTNPACNLHLENGKQSVILDGVSHPTAADPAGLGLRISEAFAKYHDDGYAPGADAWASEDGGLRVFTPRVAMAWFNYPSDATRFVF